MNITWGLFIYCIIIELDFKYMYSYIELNAIDTCSYNAGRSEDDREKYHPQDRYVVGFIGFLRDWSTNLWFWIVVSCLYSPYFLKFISFIKGTTEFTRNKSSNSTYAYEVVYEFSVMHCAENL